MDEVWKPLVGYEGCYEISSYGRVKSINREVWNPGRSCFRKQSSRILKLITDNKGYKRVMLSKDGKPKQHLVHRLVAITFLQNPMNYPHINHKNENTGDNRFENLEWCDIKYNNNYGGRGKRISERESKPVLQYTMDGVFLKEWSNSREVERELGIANQHVITCCNGGSFRKGVWINSNHAGGFKWKFKENKLKIK